jgi:hypothetical protein
MAAGPSHSFGAPSAAPARAVRHRDDIAGFPVVRQTMLSAAAAARRLPNPRSGREISCANPQNLCR